MLHVNVELRALFGFQPKDRSLIAVNLFTTSIVLPKSDIHFLSAFGYNIRTQYPQHNKKKSYVN